MALAGKKRPAGALLDTVLTGDASNEDSDSSLKKAKKGQKKHKPLPESKFGGMTEEEVCKLLLPDHMKPGLDIIFVSIQNSPCKRGLTGCTLSLSVLFIRAH